MDGFGAYIPPERADLSNDCCKCVSICCCTNGGFRIEVIENAQNHLRFCGNIKGLVGPVALTGYTHPRRISFNVTGGSLKY